MSIEAPSKRPIPAIRPLMPMPAVMWALDRDEDQVLKLVEDGQLPWVFDISAKGALARSVRILTECVIKFANGADCNYRDGESEWRRVASLIFPDKPVMVTCEAARALNCCGTHVINLIRSGELRAVPGTRWHCGPGGSARIETAGARQWLKSRRVT